MARVDCTGIVEYPPPFVKAPLREGKRERERRRSPTSNGGMQRLSWNICTFLALFCTLSRCLLTKLLHRSSVGSLLRVRCWLGEREERGGERAQIVFNGSNATFFLLSITKSRLPPFAVAGKKRERRLVSPPPPPQKNPHNFYIDFFFHAWGDSNGVA